MFIIILKSSNFASDLLSGCRCCVDVMIYAGRKGFKYLSHWNEMENPWRRATALMNSYFLFLIEL